MTTALDAPTEAVGEPPAPLGRRFLTVWAGQTASMIGSQVSAIGAAVYVFVETGSAVWLGVLTAVAALPAVLAAPLMTLVDRFPRRTVMLAGDSVAALAPVLLLVTLRTGHLEVWHIAAAAFVGELGTAFQGPASQAAVPLLVRPEALGRANSLGQLGPALGIVIGPLLAAPLVATWGLTPVLIVDLVTFTIAVSTVLATPFEERTDADLTTNADAVAGTPAGDPSWAPVRAFLFDRGRPLLALIAVGAVINAVLAVFNVAVFTLASTIGGAGRVGLPVAAIGAAMIVGSIVAGARGVARDRIATFAVGLLAVCAGCVVIAARPSLWFVCVGGALAVCLVPAVNAASATIFHERVPADMQGRLFGLRQAIGGGLYPAASAGAGVLIVEVGAPAMDGPLAGSLGRLIGSGPERGGALVVLVAGLLLGIIAIGLVRSPIRRELHADQHQPTRNLATSS